MLSPDDEIRAANAVRYGTAKAEWFLNAVSSTEHGKFHDVHDEDRRLSFLREK